MPPLRDLTGQIFGRLTVESRAPSRPHHHGVIWRVRCVCGERREVSGSDLVGGHTVSCGCWRHEAMINGLKTTHDRSKTREYKVWHAAKSRCCNPHNHAYSRYGGRGIYMVDKWRNDFAAFFTDMGQRPSPRHTLERRDNNGPYAPENCYWATRAEQNNNKRTNQRITHDGVTRTLSEWAHGASINPEAFRRRLLRGWSIEKALTTPVLHTHR